uniref:Uncharacterized protein n=1 Tax=Anopheles darlingi TaxID=43151 RepID=A0A2M4DRL4_ANODA
MYLSSDRWRFCWLVMFYASVLFVMIRAKTNQISYHMSRIVLQPFIPVFVPKFFQCLLSLQMFTTTFKIDS